MLGSMGAAGWALFPEGTEIEIKESTRGDAYNVFDKRIERANSELSKGILTETMTTENGSSLSQSEVHLEVLKNLVSKDADKLRDVVNFQLIPKMIKHGFPLSGYRFDWYEGIDFTPEQQIAYEKLLLDRFEIDPKYFIDKYNVPIIGKGKSHRYRFRETGRRKKRTVSKEKGNRSSVFRLSPSDYEGLHRRAGMVYYGGEMPLSAPDGEDGGNVDTSGVEASFLFLMRWLYRQPEFTPEMLAGEEVKRFIRSHADILDKAVDYTLHKRPMDEISVRRLKESNYVFSGFKTFHELNEAFPSLLDADGNRKPFEHFLNDVQKVNETYNRWYLKAEYNFAMASAAMAARWEQWWNNEDRGRYLLQYRTVGDKRVREAHRALHNVTLPITSGFWDEYFPPNGWNCRCTVVRVRRDKYKESDEYRAMLAGSQATAGKHQEMMRFNPGKQMACFPFYNPYTIRACKDCPDRPGTLKLTKVPDNELCAACKVIREMARQKDELKKLRAEIKDKAQFLKNEPSGTNSSERTSVSAEPT